MTTFEERHLYGISRGKEESFRRLVDHYAERMYQYSLHIVGDPRDAEEVISDVFLKVWQHREMLPDKERLPFYLYKAIKNTSLNYLKKKNRKKEIENSFFFVRSAEDAGLSPEELIISKENTRDIRRAVNNLPARCRQIFLLVKEDNLSYQEVASLLDISPATVNVQITIALKKIWGALQLSLRNQKS